MTAYPIQKLNLDYKALLCDAYTLAAQSPDDSTQIGSFLVSGSQVEWLTRDFNRPANGFTMTEADWERPTKYSLVEHSERNTIYDAALYGICTAGGLLVATWAACAECARAIVQCGIRTLVRHYPPRDVATERWLGSVGVGDRILKAGGVKIIDVVGPIAGAPPILRGGKLWDPS